jgi:hypothetical protein
MRDLRAYIEAQLSLHDLGTLVYVKGPEPRETYFEGIGRREHYGLTIKYRLPGSTNHLDDHAIHVNIGNNNRGGWTNQRNIRLAIAAEANLVKEHEFVATRWSSSQKAITSGAERTESGAYEL